MGQWLKMRLLRWRRGFESRQMLTFLLFTFDTFHELNFDSTSVKNVLFVIYIIF